MSIDPERPPDHDPAAQIPPEAPGENGDTPPLKRRFKKLDAESSDDEKSDQTIQLLRALLEDLTQKKQQPTSPDFEAKATKYHRLSKTGLGTAGAPEPAPAAIGGPLPALAAGAEATDVVPPVLPAVTFRPAPTRATPVLARWLWLGSLGLIVCGGIGYLAGFYVRAPEVASVVQSQATAPAAPWTEAMLSQLDKALAADEAGDLPGAKRIASSLVPLRAPMPPGLGIYLAGVNIRQDHVFDAQADLLRGVTNAPPSEAAAIDERLGFDFSRSREFEKAVGFYQTASTLDPFSAPLYYHWGEALRHLGHLRDAATAFRRALDRIPTGQPESASLRECIELKQRLSLVEEGRDADFQAEMAERLKAPVPSGYWLLTAAAVALQHKDVAGAVGFLSRARETLGATQFDDLLNDYFFRTYADRGELADFFPSDSAARRSRLMPTMTYSVEP